MRAQLDVLKQRLADVHNLNRAMAVLSWDQHTYMPPGGAFARAAQTATLSRLAHDIFIAPETGELLHEAVQEIPELQPNGDDADLLRVAQRDYSRAIKVPTSLVTAINEHSVLALPVWVRARQENDFASFAPYLEKTLELSRELAEHLGYEEHIYDALLDEAEPGMKTSQMASLFDTLRRELVPLVRAISERLDRVDDAVLHQPFDEAKQEGFGRMVVERFGYDFSRGRQDRTIHPFETTFSRNDVRITTRFDPAWLNPALFGTMHEAGHGLYEQGIAPSLEGTLLARGASLGLHESQSRLWENVVGRSRPFWEHFYPLLQETFPQQLSSVTLDDFYLAVNRVEPSFTRVEADEVTYNLHTLLRFEMELDLLQDRYSVTDAPEVWKQKMDEYLGIRPPSDSLGILQDVHWSGGVFGYFPTYTLGNILSVQFFEAAVRDFPEIPQHVGQGDFGALRSWLTDKIYRHGRKYEPNELIEMATGEPIQSRSYTDYLKKKYGEIYGLS